MPVCIGDEVRFIIRFYEDVWLRLGEELTEIQFFSVEFSLNSFLGCDEQRGQLLAEVILSGEFERVAKHVKTFTSLQKKKVILAFAFFVSFISSFILCLLDFSFLEPNS